MKTEFDCDYLMVHENGKAILHLGLVKSANSKDIYHCNSFLTTYQTDREKDLFFCHLSKRYEISKIVRKDKQSKRAETIYQSQDAECRERSGIKKMLIADGIEAGDKLVTEIVKVNLIFGKYHLLQELQNQAAMLAKCSNKREGVLVSSMNRILAEAYEQKGKNCVEEKT